MLVSLFCMNKPEYKSLMISSYLPETRDQLRIKGKAHILTSAAFRATHEHLPDYLRNKTDRVNALLQHLYAEQSPVRRASYAFGAPGAPLVEDASHPKHMAEEKKEISDAAWERYLKHPEEAPHVQTCLDRFALLFFEAESCDWTTCFGNPNTRALFTLSEDVTWFSTPLHA